MSAITAILNLDERPVTDREMKLVLDSLEHRGSDASGIRIEGNVGLGHRMRWTTPESKLEHLPLIGRESGAVITCDARIDNRDDLIPRLSFGDRKDSEITDADIILGGYEKWGDDLLPLLVGDFVFAIWDPRRKRLLCARDSMGVKHFYYYHRPGRLFALASEIKALLRLPGVPKELNETNIGDVLILNYQDKEGTPYKNIKRLPANTALTLERGDLRVREYWKPKPRRRRSFRSARSFEEGFLDIFSKAVKSRLRCAYPVGSLLSGGLDSSAISCVASRTLGAQDKKLKTFSAVFPSIAEVDSRIDERRFIDSVVKHIDCEAKFVEADSFSPLEDMDRLQWHADHPIGAPNVFMDWALFKAAKEKNVRVLLSGFDGDSTVSYGYEAFEMLARRGHWVQLFRNAAALSRNMPHRHHTLKKLVWNRGLKPATPDPLRQIWRVLRGRPATPVKEKKLPSSLSYNYNSINATFAEEQNLKQRYFDLVEQHHPHKVSDEVSHWNSLNSGLFAFALETFEKAASAFDLEPRFPFFDRRLIEFCISLPARQKIHNGWTRSILRRSMKEVLPSAVRWRTDKANIGLSFRLNLLRYGFRDVEETIFEAPQVLAKYVDILKLTGAYEKYRSDPLGSEAEPMLINSSVYLSNWLRKEFAGNHLNGIRELSQQ